MGSVRGKAILEPGFPHYSYFHNSREYNNAFSMKATLRENTLYNTLMNDDIEMNNQKNPWIPLEIDREQKARKKITKKVVFF